MTPAHSRWVGICARSTISGGPDDTRRRSAIFARNTPSMRASSITPSLMWRSLMASSWGAGSAFRSTVPTAWPAAGGADAAFASANAALIRTKSPTSLKIALAQMQRGGALDFAECMRTEFRIVSRVVRGHDFYEGIRAVIIDKDQGPRWEPPALEAVSTAEVERHFAPLASELELP